MGVPGGVILRKQFKRITHKLYTKLSFEKQHALPGRTSELHKAKITFDKARNILG